MIVIAPIDMSLAQYGITPLALAQWVRTGHTTGNTFAKLIDKLVRSTVSSRKPTDTMDRFGIVSTPGYPEKGAMGKPRPYAFYTTAWKHLDILGIMVLISLTLPVWLLIES